MYRLLSPGLIVLVLQDLILLTVLHAVDCYSLFISAGKPINFDRFNYLDRYVTG